jgi:hypothetical protein
MATKTYTGQAPSLTIDPAEMQLTFRMSRLARDEEGEPIAQPVAERLQVTGKLPGRYGSRTLLVNDHVAVANIAPHLLTLAEAVIAAADLTEES